MCWTNAGLLQSHTWKCSLASVLHIQTSVRLGVLPLWDGIPQCGTESARRLKAQSKVGNETRPQTIQVYRCFNTVGIIRIKRPSAPGCLSSVPLNPFKCGHFAVTSISCVKTVVASRLLALQGIWFNLLQNSQIRNWVVFFFGCAKFKAAAFRCGPTSFFRGFTVCLLQFIPQSRIHGGGEDIMFKGDISKSRDG